MADGYISEIKLPDNKTYSIKDSKAIYSSNELLTTNSFAPNSLRGPYISKIDNALYAANKRWTVSGTNISNIVNLFDGNYESTGNITAGKTSVITIDFDPNHNNSAYFPGYPYGYILVSFYYTSGPSSVSGRVYCNYNATGHGVGWHNISFSPMSDNTSSAIVYRSEHQGYYNISQLEITIVAGSAEAKLTQIEMHLDRPRSDLTPFLSKYNAETLYYDLTAPKFIGALEGIADKAKAANLTTTQWGIAYYSDATGTFAGTGTGTSGQYLKSNGTSAPTWATFSASTVGLGNVENTKLSTWTGSSNITTVGTISSGTWQGTPIASAYIGSHTHSYASSSSAGGAANSANALNFVHTNEILIGNTNAQSGIHINHRRVSGGATSGNTAITDYYFKNGNGAVTGVTIHAANFDGIATKATGDADGNAIKTTYAKLASPTFTGTPKSVTPGTDSDAKMIATKEYVDGIVAAADALVYKGTRAGASSSSNGGTLMPAGVQGDTYKVSTAGYINGKYCEVGDMIICVTDVVASTSSNYTTTINSWNIIQTSEGSVSTSETSVTDGDIVLFSGATGRFIKNSSKSLSTVAPSSSSNDTVIPTSKAVWNAISGASGYGKTGTVTSITLIQGAGITVSNNNTAIETSGSRTISITGMNTSSGSDTKCLTQKGNWVTFGTSNLTIGTTNSTAMAGNTTVTNVNIAAADTTSTGTFPIVFAASNTNTTTAQNEGLKKTPSKLYFQPSTGTLTATTFSGNIAWSNVTDKATVSKTAAGLCPQLPNETTTTKYLRQDGTWVATPNDNTHYTTKLIAGGSSATAHAEVSNGNVYLRLFDDSTPRNDIQLAAGSNMTITSNANGVITFDSSYTNTDTLMNYTLGATTRAYLMGSQNPPTDTTTARSAHGDMGVYLSATMGQLSAKSFSLNDGTASASSDEMVWMQWNSTDQSLDFIFA